MNRMMYRLLACLLVCLLLSLCAGAMAEQTDSKTGLVYDVYTDQDTGEEYAFVRKAVRAKKDIVIPAEIGGLPVRGLDKDFVADTPGLKEQLTTLTIEAEIRIIQACTFQYCKALTAVKLPEGLEHIGDSAFGDDMALTQVNFPSTLKTIGNRAFGWCRFSDADLPESVTKIDDVAFACVPLVSLHLGENVESIGQYAFEYNHLQTLYIPASVKTVGSQAFAASNYLQRVIIAGADTVFEPDAFEDEDKRGLSFEIVCAEGSNADRTFSAWENKSHDLEKALEQASTGVGQVFREGEWECIGLEDGTGMAVSFPKGKTRLDFPAAIAGIPVTVIGASGAVNAEGYEKVASVSIPEGVTEIREGAFRSFQSLGSVKLPGTLKAIGKEAFAYCKLTKVQLPEGLEVIGEGAFASNKISQPVLPGTLRTVGDRAFRWNGITSLRLPDSLEEIGNEAFWPFQGNSLTIPASVKKIGTCAFGPNGSPKAWNVTFLGMRTELVRNAFGDSGNVYYCSPVKYEIPSVTVNCLPGSTADLFFRYNSVKKYQKWGEDRILTLPAEPTVSASSLPADREFCEAVIPEGVEEIADGTFSEVVSLAKVTLPSTLKRIGKDAFAGCPLMEISIPEGVEAIGDGAFTGCINLSKISFSAKSSLSVIGKEAFQECSYLKTVALPKGLREIGENAFAKSGLVSASVPAGVTAIGAGAFRECEALTKLVLPVGLAEIPDYLCEFCRELKSVNIPSGVTRIGIAAFRRCRLISGLTFPEGLEEICDSAFEQFVGGAEMGYGATNGRETYTRQKNIKLPSTLKKIGKQAFLAWDAVNSVTFAPGCSIEAVEDETFAACTHLKSIVLPDTVHRIGRNAFRECFMLAKADLGQNVTAIGSEAFRDNTSLRELIVPDTLKEIGSEILAEHGKNLRVTCGEGSVMEQHLQSFYPDVKIVRPKKK